MDFASIAKKYNGTAATTAPATGGTDFTSIAQKYGGNTATNTNGSPNSTPDTGPGFWGKAGNVVKSVGNALTSSEQAFGQDIAAAIGGSKYVDQLNKMHKADQEAVTLFVKRRNEARQNGDKKLYDHFQNLINNYKTTDGASATEIFPALAKSNLQVIGDAAGVALDIAAAGALKGGKGFSLAPKITQTAEEAAKAKAAYKALSTTGKVMKIVKQTAKTSATGATIGYGYDVTQKAQNNELDFKPGMGTAVGAAVPAVIGGFKVAGAISKEQAPRIINSLIKPLKKDFSYGKNPGRAIAEEGIIANNLDELAPKINASRQKAGAEIGTLSSNLEGKAQVKINNAFKPIDDAIAEANKAPRTNASLIERLQNVKDDLLKVDAKTGTVGRNMADTSFANALDLKRLIGDLTKWTGNATDDAAVNSALKQTYGTIKDAMNKAAMKADPEIGARLAKLNEKYADLTSAEIATKYRSILNERKALFSMPVRVGTVTGIITSLASGGAAIPAVLAGAGAAALDKALESTAVKTRIASWLAKESPGKVAKFVQRYPAVGSVLKKSFSKEYTPIENVIKRYQELPSSIKQGGFIRIPGVKTFADFKPSYQKFLLEYADKVTSKQGVFRHETDLAKRIFKAHGFSAPEDPAQIAELINNAHESSFMKSMDRRRR